MQRAMEVMHGCSISGRRWTLALVASVFASFALLIASPALAAKPFCGDNKCNGGENAESCPADCSGGGGGGTTLRMCDTFRDLASDRVISDAGMQGGSLEYRDSEAHVSVVTGTTNGGKGW